MALVIRSWYADHQPDADGNYVNVSGRAEGVLGWLLTVLGIDAATRLRITHQNVY